VGRYGGSGASFLALVNLLAYHHPVILCCSIRCAFTMDIF
jgi:hypothetical protein